MSFFSFLALPVLGVASIATVAAGAEPPAASGFSPISVADADNAAITYRQAFAAVPKDAEAERQLLRGGVFGPWDESARDVLTRGAEPLRIFHRAAAQPRCDWQLDYSLGPKTETPHLAPALRFIRLVILEAKERLAAGDFNAAVKNALELIVMGRRVGQGPHLISLLVDHAIESSTGVFLAANLPRLDRPSIQRLSSGLRELPPAQSLADCMEGEAKIMITWLQKLIDEQGDRAGSEIVKMGEEAARLMGSPDYNYAPELASLKADDMRQVIATYAADHAGLAKIARTSFTERARAHEEFEEWLRGLKEAVTSAREAGRPIPRDALLHAFSETSIPLVGAMVPKEMRMQVRRELLAAAIAVQQRSESALREFPDPASPESPFGYRKTISGFELESKFQWQGKPEILRVGFPG